MVVAMAGPVVVAVAAAQVVTTEPGALRVQMHQIPRRGLAPRVVVVVAVVAVVSVTTMQSVAAG